MWYKMDPGDAEVLVGVDGEWRGIQVEALPKERGIIEYDPTTSTGALENPAGSVADAPVER